MKCIIAGSRTLTNTHFILSIIEALIQEHSLQITEVVSGTAKGVDSIGEEWAKKNNIPIKPFKPDWEILGKKAGIIRNERMAEYGEALLAIVDLRGPSTGTRHMIEAAKARNLPVYVKYLNADQIPIEEPINYRIYKSPDISKWE